MCIRIVISLITLTLLLNAMLCAAPGMDAELWSPLVPRVPEGHEYVVAPGGTATGQGTQTAP